MEKILITKKAAEAWEKHFESLNKHRQNVYSLPLLDRESKTVKDWAANYLSGYIDGVLQSE